MQNAVVVIIIIIVIRMMILTQITTKINKMFAIWIGQATRRANGQALAVKLLLNLNSGLPWGNCEG